MTNQKPAEWEVTFRARWQWLKDEGLEDFEIMIEDISSLLKSERKKIVEEIEKIEVWTLKYPDSFGMRGKTIELIDLSQVKKNLKFP